MDYPALKKTKALCHLGSLKSRGYTNLSWRVRKVRVFSNTKQRPFSKERNLNKINFANFIVFPSFIVIKKYFHVGCFSYKCNIRRKAKNIKVWSVTYPFFFIISFGLVKRWKTKRWKKVSRFFLIGKWTWKSGRSFPL